MNDEPLTNYKIFSHYKIICRDKKIALLKKVVEERLRKPRLIASESCRWNEWIKVPANSEGILRARINFSRNLIGNVKELVYKEEEYFIEYKLNDGEIKKYRLVIDNAVCGVWVSPLFEKISNPFYGRQVQEIRLSYPADHLLTKEIKVGWESIEPMKEGLIHRE